MERSTFQFPVILKAQITTLITMLTNEGVMVQKDAALIVVPSESIVYFHQSTILKSSIGE